MMKNGYNFHAKSVSYDEFGVQWTPLNDFCHNFIMLKNTGPDGFRQ